MSWGANDRQNVDALASVASRAGSDVRPAVRTARSARCVGRRRPETAGKRLEKTCCERLAGFAMEPLSLAGRDFPEFARATPSI